jgi:hypothetical protein
MTRHAGGCGRSRWRAEGRARSTDVSIHACFRDPQQIGDFFRRETAGNRAQHLTLTTGQCRDRSRAPPENASGNEIPGENSYQRGSQALHQEVSDRGLR